MSVTNPAVVPHVGPQSVQLGALVADAADAIGVFKSPAEAVRFAHARGGEPLAVVREGDRFVVRRVVTDTPLTTESMRAAINSGDYHPPAGTVAMVVPGADGRAQVVKLQTCATTPQDSEPPISDYQALGQFRVGSSSAYTCEPGFRITDGLAAPQGGVRLR